MISCLVLKLTVEKLVSIAANVADYSLAIKSHASQTPLGKSMQTTTTSGYCITDKTRYLKGQIFKRDECTNCMCTSNGQVVCEKLECEPRTCLDGSKLRYFSGICCPLCESEIQAKYPFLNHRVKHANLKRNL